MKKFLAFTLAEVLITLGIIGVVAALTIPSLQAKIIEREMISRLKTTYSTLAEAYRLASNDLGEADSWDIGQKDTPDGSKKMYNILKHYIVTIQDCNNNKGCFATNYRSLFGNSYIWQPNTHKNYAKGILSNGTSILVWSGGSKCYKTKTDNTTCGAIKVDLNGIAPPNRAGVDYFSFVVRPEGIFPEYFSKNMDNGYGEYCAYNDKGNKNGVMCTGWVIKHNNMDYLRRDVSKEY